VKIITDDGDFLASCVVLYDFKDYPWSPPLEWADTTIAHSLDYKSMVLSLEVSVMCSKHVV
jgi:hypothetical protein